MVSLIMISDGCYGIKVSVTAVSVTDYLYILKISNL